MAHRIENIGSDAAVRHALLQLNNANAQETSLLDATTFNRLIGVSCVSKRVVPAAAFLLAMDQSSGYDGGHFLWFRERLPRFLYIDRVIVGAAVRRAGLGRVLYENLFAEAARRGHDVVACEVNKYPPNPVSDAFHARLGFTAFGTAAVPGADKVVRYLVRRQ